MLFVILDLGCVCFLGIVSSRRYDGPFVFVGRAHTHTQIFAKRITRILGKLIDDKQCALMRWFMRLKVKRNHV